MPLSVGDPAPNITAPNQDGDLIQLDLTAPTVVYFYPRDATPGCTTEACQFNAELPTYRDAGVQVFGISTDHVEDHAEFAADQNLEFDLLADPDHDIAAAYKVPVRNGAAARVTYVIAGNEIKAVYPDVSPDGHARDIFTDMIETGIIESPW